MNSNLFVSNDIVVLDYVASLRADAGHRAEEQGNYCAHRIEARVARSRGDSAEIFKKFSESVRFYKNRLFPRIRNLSSKSDVAVSRSFSTFFDRCDSFRNKHR